MLVLVASTGAAVSVACDAASSVGAVGDALASHPDVAVPRRDQLLIFEGRRLEGETRTLGEYGLPERAGDAEAAQDDEEPRFKRDAEYVFLYRKSALVSDKSEKRSSSSSSRAFEEPSRDGERSSRDDPVHTTDGAISIEIAPTPPPPRSDGSHPLERAAVAFFVDSSKKTGPVTNDQKGVKESDITNTVDVSETSSRLHRLVALERSLEHAAARVEATNAASTKRVNAAATLTRATRVRALAADAASASAETHLAAALAAHAEFMRRANERVRFQTDLLSTFEDDLETLQTTTLFSPSLEKTPPDDERKQKKTTRETKTLLDLVDVSRLREKRDAAKNAHDSFVAKLHALDSRVARLKQETELLFMTLPEVDVEALEAELESARDALRAQNAIVEEVRADAATARAIAARCVAALAESSVSTEDSAETNDSKDSKDSAETMADGQSASTRRKENQLLSAEEIDALSNADASRASHAFARVAATDDVLAAFHAHCATCASAMDANARALLVKIAETQNEIAKLRDARFAFEEIADRTEKPFCFLFGACRALPKRHAACLAEKARRVAYADRLAARARRAADLFAADREEERERRDAFRKTLVKTEERFFGKGRTEKSAFSQALDAVTNATLGSVSSAPSVEITVRCVSRAEAGSAPTRPEPETKEETKNDDVDEALAAVFAESL